MINYIIIENEEKYCNRIKQIINNLMDKKDYHINVFYTLNDKLKEIINKELYKIYIIDFYLDSHINGIDIAKLIRNIDYESEIIFIGSQDILFETIFKNIPKVYTFLSKYSNLELTLTTELSQIINNYYNKTKYISLDKKGDIKLALNEILYIYRETVERKLYIVTKDNKYPICLSIKDIVDSYKNYFLQVHRACLVNPTYVVLYNYQEGYFLLKNNTKVFMCSKKYKDVQNH